MAITWQAVSRINHALNVTERRFEGNIQFRGERNGKQLNMVLDYMAIPSPEGGFGSPIITATNARLFEEKRQVKANPEVPDQDC